MDNVKGSNSSQPLTTEANQCIDGTPDVPATTGPARTTVTKHPDAMAEDSKLESSLRASFEGLEAGDSCELAGTFGVKADLAAEFKGKVKVERQQDGTFMVEVEGSGEGGIGAPGAGAGRVGVAAGTRFHVSSAAEAADLSDALLKGAVVTGSGTGPILDLAAKAGIGGDLASARGRIADYLSNVASVKAEGLVTAQLGDGWKLEGWEKTSLGASAKVSAQARGGITINLERGEIQRTVTVSLSGDATAQLPLNKFDANAKGTVSVVVTNKIPPELIEALKSGRISPEQLAAATQALKPVSITARAEVEETLKANSVGAAQETLRYKAEITLDTSGPITPAVALDALLKAKWGGEAEGSYGLGGAVNLGVAYGEVAVLRRYKKTGLQGSLETVLASRPGGQRSLDSMRAAANLLR
ncbi:MAG: hypothetical protein ACOZQL_03015 [Myxococcota bacterium]